MVIKQMKPFRFYLLSEEPKYFTIASRTITFCNYFSFLLGSINQIVYFCTPIVRVGFKRGNVGFPPAGPK